MAVSHDSTRFYYSILGYNLPPAVNVTITAESEEDMANFAINFDTYLVFMLVAWTLLVIGITLLVTGTIYGIGRCIKWCLKTSRRDSPSTMEAGTETAKK